MFVKVLPGLLLVLITPSQAIAGSGASARVFDPPSNVRRTPNGQILCSINQNQEIYMIGKANNNWYVTDACSPPDKPGTVWGVIHRSQINNLEFYSSFPTFDLIKFYQCVENNPDLASENC